MRRMFLASYAVERWIRWRFTPCGRLLLGALVAVALFSLNPRASSAYQLAVVIVAVIFAATLWAPLFRPRVTVMRRLPGFATVGQPFRYSIRVTNQAARALVGARLRERIPKLGRAESVSARGGYRRFLRALTQAQGLVSESVPMADCPAGGSIDVIATLRPTRRGYVELPGILFHKPDPLGVFNAFHRISAKQRVLCLPKRYRVAPLAKTGAARAAKSGASPSRISGNGLDFARLREYRPGDSLRHMHWRAWARIGEPVVKEFHEESPARSALILDTARPATDAQDVFETAVSVAASFAVDLSWQGARVDLLFAGTALLRAAQGREQEGVTRMLECLACVQPSAADTFVQTRTLVERSLSQFSSCVCVLTRFDADRLTLLRAVAAGGGDVWALLIQADDDASFAASAQRDASAIGVNLIVVPMAQVAKVLATLGAPPSPADINKAVA